MSFVCRKLTQTQPNHTGVQSRSKMPIHPTMSNESLPSLELPEVETLIIPFRQVVDDLVDVMQEVTTDPAVDFWLATGIKSVDEVMGSLHGLVAIESTTPWHGTQLAMLLAASMSRHVPAVIFTSKLSAHRIGELLFSILEGSSWPFLPAAQRPNADWASISHTQQRLSALDLTVVEADGFSTEQISRVLSDLQRQKGKVGLVVVDDALAVSAVHHTSTPMPDLARAIPLHLRWVSKNFNAAVVTVVPPGLTDGYSAVSDWLMRVEESQTDTVPQPFPPTLNVHITRGGFGYMGTVSLDLAAVRHEML